LFVIELMSSFLLLGSFEEHPNKKNIERIAKIVFFKMVIPIYNLEYCILNNILVYLVI